MTTPTENWPKPYLLQLHENAVKHGFIWVEGLTEDDYKSLKSRLYRIRRRSDASMAAFIPPEYHLVMVGNWEMMADPASNGLLPLKNEHNQTLGRFPLLFDKKADGQALPTIRVPSGEEAAAYTPPPQLAEQAPVEIDVEALDVSLAPGEIDSYVERLQKRAQKGS